MAEPSHTRHYCYALECDAGCVRSYVGYTIDPFRRIRQHNGELAGGAKRTTRIAKKNNIAWRFLFIVEVDHPMWTSRKAMSLEWHLKGRKYTRGASSQKLRDGGGALASTNRRVRLLSKALSLQQFRSFLPHMVIWTMDGEACNLVWEAMTQLRVEWKLPKEPCVMPMSAAIHAN